MSLATGDKLLGLRDIGINPKHQNGNGLQRRGINTGFTKISEEEFAGIATLRDSGNVNMMEIDSVIYFARKLGFVEAAEWITDNRQLYIKGIMKGFFHDYTKE